MSTTRFNPPYPKLEDADGDGYVAPGENDISRDQKRTLGSYLASVTRARVPQDDVVEFAGSIPERSNAFPIAEDEIRTKGFTDLIGDRVSDRFEYSNSGKFDGREDGNLDDIITKGALGEANKPTTRPSTLGHYMLNRPATAEAAVDVIKSSNSATPARPNFPDQGTTAASSRASIDNTLGQEGLSSSYDPRARRISVKDIRDSTLNMLLASTGKNQGSGDVSKWENDLTLAGVSLGKGVQGGAFRADTLDMRPARYSLTKQLNSTTATVSGPDGSTDAIITTDGLGEDRYTKYSAGVANSPFEPFTSPLSGISTFGVVSLALYASVAAISAVVLGFQKLSSLAGTSAVTPTRVSTTYTIANSPEANKRDEVLDLALGKYELENKKTPGFFGALLKSVSEGLQLAGAPSFYNPISGRNYFECAMLGYIAFLGANPDENAPLGENFTFLTISAQFIKRSALLLLLKEQRGYYETIFRNISRNINSLVNSINADPASFLSTGGIESLFSAGIVDIVQIFAKSGDMLYLRYDAATNFALGGVATQNMANVLMTDFSAFSLGPVDLNLPKRKFAAERTRSQRMSEGSRNTSMDGAQIPALRLLPEVYHGLVETSSSTISNLMRNKQPSIISKNRFTQEQVAEIEDLLESEYMPFYFQDLRTNEIISFNAFLDDVSDGFQAEYSSISGYGRIEDAKIYKGTKRSLGVKFHLFAANPDDFDSMWWQINKLTTMVYPQWSKGRELKITQGNDVAGATSKTFPFIQPFSQIPTATPVIRVRVGDLIRSNYSRFNLKRLFGFTDPVVGPAQRAAGGNFNEGTAATYKKSYKTKSEFKCYGAEDEILTVPAGTPMIQNEDPDKWDFTVGFQSLVIKKQTLKGYTDLISENSGEIDQPASFTPDSAAITAETFYNADNNAIIRSFETTAGKGLAAVCTSLKFGWMDAMWGAGADGPGYRAPRYCTVDMQFEVMHDIAPGLDADGFNRAPIYPVGDTIPRIIEGKQPEPYGRGTKSSQVTREEYNKAINVKR